MTLEVSFVNRVEAGQWVDVPTPEGVPCPSFIACLDIDGNTLELQERRTSDGWQVIPDRTRSALIFLLMV